MHGSTLSRRAHGASGRLPPAIRRGVAPIRPSLPHAPRPPRWALVLVPFLLAADSETGVPLARAEGALESVKIEAESLSTHARKIVESGRFEGMSQLHGDALALHRQVLSAQLAVEVLRELDSR
jgi:hypothetical protein